MKLLRKGHYYVAPFVKEQSNQPLVRRAGLWILEENGKLMPKGERSSCPIQSNTCFSMTRVLEVLAKWSQHCAVCFEILINVPWPRAGEEVEIDVKSFQNIMAMALLMGLVGLALSVTSAGEKTAAAVAAKAGNTRAARNGNASTPIKAKKK